MKLIWKRFEDYDSWVAVEFKDKRSRDSVLNKFWSAGLVNCPRRVFAKSLVVPWEARKLLPVQGVSHDFLELKHVGHIRPDVMKELIEEGVPYYPECHLFVLMDKLMDIVERRCLASI